MKTNPKDVGEMARESDQKCWGQCWDRKTPVSRCFRGLFVSKGNSSFWSCCYCTYTSSKGTKEQHPAEMLVSRLAPNSFSPWPIGHLSQRQPNCSLWVFLEPLHDADMHPPSCERFLWTGFNFSEREWSERRGLPTHCMCFSLVSLIIMQHLLKAWLCAGAF